MAAGDHLDNIAHSGYTETPDGTIATLTGCTINVGALSQNAVFRGSFKGVGINESAVGIAFDILFSGYMNDGEPVISTDFIDARIADGGTTGYTATVDITGVDTIRGRVTGAANVHWFGRIEVDFIDAGAVSFGG